MKNKRIHVHFVCTGNVYRSRLAEAYLRSKKLPNVDTSSSGIKAQEGRNGPITWYASIIKRNQLVEHLKNYWTQTTPQMLYEADIVVFMTDEQYHYAKNTFSLQENGV